MESVDFNDRYLDPPEEPERRECACCGEVYPYDELTRTGMPGNYRWLCDTCMIEEIDQAIEDGDA